MIPAQSAALSSAYGPDEALLDDRRRAWRRLLEVFEDAYGTAEGVSLVRAPARVNIMGVHIDHRKGRVNYLTHRREILMASRAREDDTIRIRNADEQSFPAREFSIGRGIGAPPWTEWVPFIESPEIAGPVRAAQGDWGNYVKAAAFRLQHAFPEQPLRGMEAAVLGDIPRGSGLSSSSALVVCSAIALAGLNALPLEPTTLVDLCGEGEWMVGTRGGAGDHAAMILGRRGMVAHVGFFPCRLLEYVPAPAAHDVVIINSLRQSEKSRKELSAYNQTIAAYGASLLVLKQVLAGELGFARDRLDDLVQHLGDFSLHPEAFPDTLLYRALKHIPERLSRAELLQRLPEHREVLERSFRTHDEPEEGYRTRAVAMFGLSEIARGAATPGLLRDGALGEFGRLMCISHDGDRVSQWGPVSGNSPWSSLASRVTDQYLDGLAADDAPLRLQPGGYRCSCEELDHIVDLCKGAPGVLGAGITGAGLGGCALALVGKHCTQGLIELLAREYYGPRGLEPAAESCVSVAGAGFVSLHDEE
jgi:N-acetylgalactosamine kinase